MLTLDTTPRLNRFIFSNEDNEVLSIDSGLGKTTSLLRAAVRITKTEKVNSLVVDCGNFNYLHEAFSGFNIPGLKKHHDTYVFPNGKTLTLINLNQVRSIRGTRYQFLGLDNFELAIQSCLAESDAVAATREEKPEPPTPTIDALANLKMGLRGKKTFTRYTRTPFSSEDIPKRDTRMYKP